MWDLLQKKAIIRAVVGLAVLVLIGLVGVFGCGSSKTPVVTVEQFQEMQTAIQRFEEGLAEVGRDVRQRRDEELAASQTPEMFQEIQTAIQRFEEGLAEVRRDVRQRRDEELAASQTPQIDELNAVLLRIEQDVRRLRPDVPEETERRLADLEQVLADRSQWPKEAEEAEELRQRLDQIVRVLPPAAAETIFPRLVRLNWGIESLWSLRTYANPTDEQLEDVQMAVEELLDRHPFGELEELRTELETRLADLQVEVQQSRVATLLAQSRIALEGGENEDAAYTSLLEFEEADGVAAMMLQLRARVLEKNAAERVAGLQARLDRVRSLEDQRIRQLAALSVQDDIMRLIVDLELEESKPKEAVARAGKLLTESDQEMQALSAKQQEENAKRLRQYQAWALDQIRKFDGPEGWYYAYSLARVDSDLKTFRDATGDSEWAVLREFPSVAQLLSEKLGVNMSGVTGALLTAEKRAEIYNKAAGVIGWEKSIDTEIAYRTTRDGMVKFLLPIQLQFLDPPVAQLYQQAFSKGWQKLEGRPDQLFVAQRSADVKKVMPEDLPFSGR